jgi:hypothetical protein
MSDIDQFELMKLPPHIEATVTKAVRIVKSGLYADWPGTGPAGERCATCKHIMRTHRYRKCELVRRLWTGGPGTDIKARSAACSKWEKAND